MLPLPPHQNPATKPPRLVLTQEITAETSLPSQVGEESIFAFPPNRDTLGGTSYFIVRNESNILIDCPSLEPANLDFIRSHGGVRWLFITHRGAIGKTEAIQKELNCEVVIQEQEAYLLPSLKVTTFSQQLTLNHKIQLIWTPGHSPGSSCLYYREFGGVLFSGRHLLPNQQGEPVPLRTSKTFHWPRQIKSIKSLQASFNAQTLEYICPGANTGYLRGKLFIDQAYIKLAKLDLEVLSNSQIVL
jgi:glyoxylase-like metal-dependent hydrolase (beta-lactamase superfamily II)